jgi:hypothetical protein
MGRSNSVNSLFIIAEVWRRKIVCWPENMESVLRSQESVVCVWGDAGHRSVDAFSTIKHLTKTPTRICTSSLFADAGQILGLSARCVVGLIVEMCGSGRSVNYLWGLLVMIHKDDAHSKWWRSVSVRQGWNLSLDNIQHSIFMFEECHLSRYHQSEGWWREEGLCLTFWKNCLSVAREDDMKVEPRLKGSMPDAKPWIDVSWCTL